MNGRDPSGHYWKSIMKAFSQQRTGNFHGEEDLLSGLAKFPHLSKKVLGYLDVDSVAALNVTSKPFRFYTSPVVVGYSTELKEFSEAASEVFKEKGFEQYVYAGSSLAQIEHIVIPPPAEFLNGRPLPDSYWKAAAHITEGTEFLPRLEGQGLYQGPLPKRADRYLRGRAVTTDRYGQTVQMAKPAFWHRNY